MRQARDYPTAGGCSPGRKAQSTRITFVEDNHQYYVYHSDEHRFYPANRQQFQAINAAKAAHAVTAHYLPKERQDELATAIKTRQVALDDYQILHDASTTTLMSPSPPTGYGTTN